jgi:hypothetical protein
MILSVDRKFHGETGEFPNLCWFQFFVDKTGYFLYYYYMQKKMKKSSIGVMLLLLILLLTFTTTSRAQSGFTQKDRDLLIQLNTRVNEMDKRFSELREDMNNRFGEMMTYIGILAAIFVAITACALSFALWDRRTMIRPFETKVAELDKRITANQEKYENLIPVLKEYASKNKKFADIIKQFNLF